MQGKVANLESVVSGHCTILLEHVIIVGTSCFDTDFASLMKLTKLALIHWFVYIIFYRPPRSWGKVIFSVAYVKNSVHRVQPLGTTPRADTPPGRYTRAGTPPMVNERAVRILLECILVHICYCVLQYPENYCRKKYPSITVTFQTKWHKNVAKVFTSGDKLQLILFIH